MVVAGPLELLRVDFFTFLFLMAERKWQSKDEQTVCIYLSHLKCKKTKTNNTVRQLGGGHNGNGWCSGVCKPSLVTADVSVSSPWAVSELPCVEPSQWIKCLMDNMMSQKGQHVAILITPSLLLMLLVCLRCLDIGTPEEATILRQEMGSEQGEKNVFKGLRQSLVLISCPAASVSCHLWGDSQWHASTPAVKARCFAPPLFSSAPADTRVGKITRAQREIVGKKEMK